MLNDDHKWHKTTIKDILELFKVEESKGLTTAAVTQARKKYGFNKFTPKKEISRIKIFLEQFYSPLVYILLMAGFITVLLHHYTDGMIILAIVLLNAVIGYWQEYKAMNTLKKLREVLTLTAIVIRNGHEMEIPQEEIVPGDIVILQEGSKVPADGRLISVTNLAVNEAVLTGEWLPVTKDPKPLEDNALLADRINMVYMGTIVDKGTGRFVVTGIGDRTEFGKIAQLVRETKDDLTPFQKKINRFSHKVTLIMGVIAIGIFFVGILTGKPFLEMFLVVVAVAVAAIPEGLPIVVTVVLALGMQNILKRKGLVRKLNSAETLGSTSVIATDKTGTLTMAKMTLKGIYIYDEDIIFAKDKKYKLKDKSEASLAITIGLMCSEAFVENPDAEPGKWKVVGESTERSIVAAALKAGFRKDKIIKGFELKGNIPFDSGFKYSAKMYQIDKKTVRVFSMGAPEVMMDRSGSIVSKKGTHKLDDHEKEFMLKKHDELTNDALRVLAVCYRDIPIEKFSAKNLTDPDLHNYINDLTLVGYLGLHDPVRKEVKGAIQTCLDAGIRPIMITGDNRLTAKAVFRELGIEVTDNNVMDGRELADISDKDFRKRIKDVYIYSRAAPEQKLKIVKTWQSFGEIVAMTGDGINDAPAIKQADIGVAVGSGTDVAKEIADLVLLNDNFIVIVGAVEEGRMIISNIRKVITFLFSGGFSEMILVTFVSLMGFPLPVTAVQILWVNLVEDSLPAIALAFEPREKGLMKHKPESLDAPLLTKEMKILIFFVSILTDMVLLGVFFYYSIFTDYTLEHVRTIVFIGLSVATAFYLLAYKSLERSVFRTNIFSNKILLWSILYTSTMMLVSVYVPFFQKILQTVPLNLMDWVVLISVALFNFIGIEIVKWVYNRETYWK